MKTKILRFNKLPKIQGSQNQSSESKPSSNKQIRIPTRQALLFKTNNNFKRSQSSQYNNQLIELVQNLIKKSAKHPREFELQPRDRSVLLDLPQIYEDEELDDDILKQWITDVCNNVFSSAFNALSNDKMTYEQTKIFCSESILKNIVILTKQFSLDERQMSLINQHIEQRIVSYMLKKYPMTESSDVNKAFDEKVNPIDNRQALENDLLQKCDVVFTYRQNGNYNDLIMKFLNWLMTEIDTYYPQSKRTPYNQFYEFVSKMFENVYDEAWMNQRSKNAKVQADGEQCSDDEQCCSDDESSINEGARKQKYQAKVKQYTHYAIGRKISKNVPIYTEDQIKSGHLPIKNPSILRILTKWCEELWEKFNKKNYFLDREENLRVQQKDGNINTMFMWMKIPLNNLIEEQKVRIKDFMKQVQTNNFDQQSKLLIKQLQKDGFTHIEKYEKACGKFAYRTVNNLHSYIILYLNRIIHGLVSVSKKFYQTKLYNKSRWSSPPDLLSFKIGDLMRCKCSSKQREIIKIFEYLTEISQTQPKTLKIIRVKNRLKQGTNDILINIIYQQKYLCEVQLAVISTTSKFIKCSNMFNHYIYELGRTLFGPLTQLCSIWISLDARSKEYLNLIKNEKRSINQELIGCKKKGQNHDYADLNRPFICSDCGKAYSHTNYVWSHQRCVKQQCGYMICAICQIEHQSYQKLLENLLKNEDMKIKKSCISIVNRKPKQQRAIPTFGLCVQIQSQRLKVVKFKKIEYNKIVTLFGFKRDHKTNKQVVTKLEELVKRDAQKRFFNKYLVFEIPDQVGEKLIDIDIDRAKKQYIIPEKIKSIYKKEMQILSLIEENIDDKSIEIVKGKKQDMENIINMELADNKLTNITFIAENFPKIQRLQLSRNSINSVDTILKLKNLKKLNLRNNELAQLPDQICQLPLLEGLNIRFNKIKAFPLNFGNLKFMSKIESDNNEIATLPESFNHLTKLTFLDLSYNKLTAFPQCVRNWPHLKELLLAKNKLQLIPQWIGQLKQLIYLDFSQTSVSNLPQSIFGLTKLEGFKIQTSYPTISEKIGDLMNLKHFSIKMPNLKELPEKMFNLTNNLQTLELQECKVGLPDWLSDMKQLQTFSLINNNIQKLPKQITEMTNLKFLKIEGQNICELPNHFDNLRQLRSISLDNNQFRQIPSVIRSFEKIFAFSIKNNNIEFIQDSFFDTLLNIQNLSFDNNKIRKLPFSISKLKRLKVVTYENNLLQNRPEWMKIIHNTVYKTVKAEQFIYKEHSSINKPK